MSYVSYDVEDTCVSYEEDDACMYAICVCVDVHI